MTTIKKNKPELRFPKFFGDYKKGRLKDFGFFYYGKSAPKHSIHKNAKTPCVRYGELYSTYKAIIRTIRSYTDIHPKHLKFSKGGEILIPRVGEDPLGFANCSYLPLENVAVGEMISIYNTNENGLFVTYYINAMLKKQFARVVEGGNVSNLYYRYLEDIEIVIPPRPEQEKISDFIINIDNKIEQLTRKKRLLEKYKKGVMQKIFSQEIRFKHDDGCDYPDWEEKQLSKCLIPTFREIPKPSEPYLAIGIRSHCKGTFQKPNSDPSKIAMDKLYVVKKDDLIVNITFAWEGAIALIKNEDDGGLVSHRFPTYTFNKKEVLKEFFKYVIIQKRFRYTLDVISPGGAGRNRVLSKKDFLKIKLILPQIEEQRKISTFLGKIEQKIETLNIQLMQTQQFKKGLLQQMFV